MRRSSESISSAEPWVSRLAPIALLVLIFAVLEGGTRIATRLNEGARKAAEGVGLMYSPYVMNLNPKKQWVSHPTPKPPGSFRIVILGSSTAEQIPDEEVVQELGKFVDRPVDVVNMAQSGYVTNQMVVMYSLYSIDFQPDLVLSLSGLNDFYSASNNGVPGLPSENEKINEAINEPTRNAVDRILDSSAFISAVTAYKSFREENGRLKDEKLLRDTELDVESAILKLARLTTASGSAYIGAVQPYIHLKKSLSPAELKLKKKFGFRPLKQRQISKGLTAIGVDLTQATPRAGAMFVPTGGAFDNMPADVAAFKDEAHLTHEGRLALLDFVFSQAAARGLLPQR
jgi:hypothetical protein